MCECEALLLPQKTQPPLSVGNSESLKNRVRVLLLGCNIDERGVVMNGAGRESGTHGYY